MKNGKAVFEASMIGIREMPMNDYTNQNKATDAGRLFLDQPSLGMVCILCILLSPVENFCLDGC